MLRYLQRTADRNWFPCPEDMSPALHRLLLQRGIASEAEAKAFLNPGISDLYDPLLLSDMTAAKEKLRCAMTEGAPICIYGDYDVDGVCASSILYLWLKRMDAKVSVYLPSRHHEGYGLNEAAIREIAGWAKLMVTVDCGVTSVELVKQAKDLGLDVVVTDHHRPAEKLPDCPVVNPLLNEYPFPALCGAGVAWKLVCAMAGLETAMEYIDIAALATVADVVSLTGENRAIVRMGLKQINESPRPGIDALIQTSGLSEKKITSTHLAFQLAPRLNAGGRIGSAMRSWELITADNAVHALPLAEELEQENVARKDIEQEILSAAERQLKDFDFAAHRILILSGKGWNAGVIGLAASRLVEKYHYPVIVLSDQETQMTGSCRSIEGVDIHAALCACSEYLERFGGHKQAAGLTLLPERLPAFRSAMDEYLFENIDPNVYIPGINYDMKLDFGEITQGFIASLEALQPTGFGNPAPIFRAETEILEKRSVGADGAHLRLTLSQNSHRLNGIAFREGYRVDKLSDRADILFTPKINAYMGRTEVQLEVRALADSDIYSRIQSEIDGEAALQCKFLTQMFYNKKINQYSREEKPADENLLRQLLNDTPQGTLILTSDFEGAVRILRLTEPATPDLLIGELPEDGRAFNAVCVCPPVGKILTGYKRIFIVGIPEEYPMETGAQIFVFQDSPAWMKLAPDIEILRAVWRALVHIGKRPVIYKTMEQLLYLICADSGTDSRAAMASLLTMHDLGLIELDIESAPVSLKLRKNKKADPEESFVWRSLQRWRVQ